MEANINGKLHILIKLRSNVEAGVTTLLFKVRISICFKELFQCRCSPEDMVYTSWKSSQKEL